MKFIAETLGFTALVALIFFFLIASGG